MLDPLKNYRDRQRVLIALSRGAGTRHSRDIDLRHPETWEFCGFSQNGEDGIIDVLRSQLSQSNRYCVEIGIEDGIECNTAWLLVAEKYRGLMIEGNAYLARRAQRIIGWYNNAAQCHHLFLTKSTVTDLRSMALESDPDVFSLDIDGNDYHVAQAIFESGFRPKIFVVEYNAVFGPHRSLTIAYDEDFSFKRAHPSELYYGVSIAAWKKLFKRKGYHFITVDRNGVNAFFVDPVWFKPGFIKNVRSLAFAENQFQLRRFRKTNEEQFAMIADQAFVSV